MKIKLLPILPVLILAISCSRNDAFSYGIVPEPHSVEYGNGAFKLDGNATVTYSDAVLENEAGWASKYIKDETALELAAVAGENGDIRMSIDSGLSAEQYVLDINSKGVNIVGGSPAGVFYGVQTLRKCIASAGDKLPAVHIEDWPAFGYRGAHFDVCRHFFTVDEVKTYLDMMALHNMNELHWHITEDQGWRIEIKKYPRLVEIGSRRDETLIGRPVNAKTDLYDGTPYGGYYTQDEVRGILKYAESLHIDVIPEIDLPGHMQAALAAYPELGCTGGPYKVWTKWGVSEDVLCAGNPKIYDFLDDVLDEIMDLFPSKYVHVGGDECPKVRWHNCPKCNAFMAELGLKDDEHHSKEDKLQSYVMKHVSDHITARGRTVIGWDETLEGGAAPGSIIMSWRGEAGGIEAAKAGHDVIMTPSNYLYFDHYQTTDTENEPLAIGGFSSVRKVYETSPVPSALNAEEAKHIIGIQANLWTEYIPDFKQVQYMVLPRWAALSENQWGDQAQKNYDDFLKRLPVMMGIYAKYGYNYAKHVYDIDGRVFYDVESHAVKVDLNALDNDGIYYTVDGSAPDANSRKYNGILTISSTADFKASAMRDGKMGNIFEEKVYFNKATAHDVVLETTPHRNYTYNGAEMLVDGLRGGNTRYNSGRWLGFIKNPIIAVIDLGSATEISKVTASMMAGTGDGIFDAANMTVSVSDDGKIFNEVAKDEYPELEGEVYKLMEHVISFEPVKTRYVKVQINPYETAPAWSPYAGTSQFLFIDEIAID